MSVEQSLLGQTTSYPTQYAPEILFPIARAPSRQAYANIAGINQGMDWWHAFELSWLDMQDKPQVAIGRLHIPAASEFLIESKSLKLYFNSLNFTQFSSPQAFIDCVEHDLSRAANAIVRLELYSADELLVSQPTGICLDQFSPNGFSIQPDANLLKLDSSADQQPAEVNLYSHLLRSNCPVTGQPDWGTLFIKYHGIAPCYSSLLAYIISYRQHSGFHEQCVEQVFADIWQQLQPERLMVYAAYTRRGGLDINPCRVSDLEWLPSPIRLARQ
ncbi:NADPH-dependent 7-cyano-7-deazaguanine reductase QueF [Alkanindiges sp. WGS2144]|uniref:NADPH-dependent 7-cyano-7-deazaguanine reductase QueF n=1 Tax=Alkanindiges sp. WGS2144 TaxID=3366808 RepID=UPI00374FFD7A